MNACLAVEPPARLIHFASIESTMTEAGRLAASGDFGPLWIVADEQTGGRGRLGRSWISPFGNLHATLLMPAPCPIADQPKLGFAMGVALAAVIDEVTGTPHLSRLKWPNDVLIDGAKVAGLLVEGLGSGKAIAVGMGVNIVEAPQGLAYPTQCLKHFNPKANVRTLLMSLSQQVTQQLEIFAGAAGFGETRRLWLQRAAHLGQQITVRDNGTVLSGRFVDLDPAGRLLLDDGSSIHVVAAGDVFPFRTG